MTTRLRVLLALALATLVAGGLALAGSDDDEPVAVPTTGASESSTTVATTTTTSVATTTTEAPLVWPVLPGDGVPRAVVTPTGVVLAVQGVATGGRYVVASPCGAPVTVAGVPLTGATVVLDPGHGGDEPGAVGPAGTLEKDVNLAVAVEAQRQLEAAGATVVLTRTGDYRITLASRRAIANALRPLLFVSIHHNAEPDGPHDGPGAETYFQIASAESKRAAGLVYESVRAAFSAHPITWMADADAGAKYRLRTDGTDYYGILHGVEVPAVLSEAAFISNPPEEALLATPEFQAVEARAIADAVERFVFTDDPGSGFTEPYRRAQPAGPGGGSQGCENPPLG